MSQFEALRAKWQREHEQRQRELGPAINGEPYVTKEYMRLLTLGWFEEIEAARKADRLKAARS